jgi:hypothetical protein
MSGVSGALARPADPTILFTGCAMQFRQPPPKFKVLVYPVGVAGYCSGRANIANIYAAVRSDLTAMFPIRPRDIQMSAGPRAAVECGPLASLSAVGLWTHRRHQVAPLPEQLL